MRPQRLNLLLAGAGIVVASLGGFALGVGHAGTFAGGVAFVAAAVLVAVGAWKMGSVA